MSSKSRIVETNSSGIVTIVIDDDSDCKISSVSQTVKASRPVMGVRPPVKEQSPKFVLSDNSLNNNQQKILIQENRNNIILVNSSHKSTHNSPLFKGTTNGNICYPSSSSTRVSCIASQSQTLPTEVKSHHNYVSRNETHYVMVDKPIRQIPNTTTTITATSSVSKSSTSPTKYRLWQPSNQLLSRSPSIRPSGRMKESKALPPEDVESDCMDDQTYFKYLNLIPRNEYLTKHKTELRVNWPLRNIAKISKPETTSEGKILLPNLKFIRNPFPTMRDMTQDFNDKKIEWYKKAKQYNDRLQKFKANLPTNQSIRERLQTDLELLHKQLMAEKKKHSEEEDRYRKLKSIENRNLLLREEQKQELEYYINAFELTSLMGQRVRDSTDVKILSAQDIFYMNNRNEEYCCHRDICSVNVSQSTKSSTRITRSNTGFAGIDRMWGPRSESHEYCFNRKQRLEKYLRLETGLNWKSRIIAMQCKPVDVEITKVTRCPCCLELVEPEWGHSCRDTDCELDSNNAEVISISISGEDSESGLQSEANYDEEINSVCSEIITAGNVVCYECGFEECTGDCIEEETPVTKISINDENETPILVFASNETKVQLKQQIEDKIMVQKVPLSHDCNVQRIADQKSRIINEKIGININNDDEEESEDDIVIIKEVQREQQCHNIHNSTIEPVIIRLTNNSGLRSTLKRKFSDSKTDSIINNSSEVKITKCK